MEQKLKLNDNENLSITTARHFGFILKCLVLFRIQWSEYRNQNRMKTAFAFKDIEVWQKAHQLVLHIYETSKHFPKEEMFGLSSQLRRAAVSIPANIAEGFKRQGTKDKIRFYNIAQSSLEEVRYYLILVKVLDFAKTEEQNQLTSGRNQQNARILHQKNKFRSIILISVFCILYSVFLKEKIKY